MFSLEKKKLWSGPTVAFQYLEGATRKMKRDLFITAGRTGKGQWLYNNKRVGLD